MQSPAFLTSTLANYLALIFRRLCGEGHVEVEENGRICDGLVVLLCISRGCQFQATENATKSQNTTLKHMVSYLY